jgi:molecular chaperone GrpE
MKRHETEEPAESGVPNDELPVSGATPESVGDFEAVLRERDEYLASWKRAAADYQNLRRRLQSDLESAIARQKTGILSDLLLVLDYLDMALATPVTTDEGRNLHAGVEATRTALFAVLEREGARPIPDTGTFDPAIHDCVARVDVEGVEPGTIVEVLRRGYRLEGRILRPAQVKVAGATDDSPGE